MCPHSPKTCLLRPIQQPHAHAPLPRVLPASGACECVCCAMRILGCAMENVQKHSRFSRAWYRCATLLWREMALGRQPCPSATLLCAWGCLHILCSAPSGQALSRCALPCETGRSRAAYEPGACAHDHAFACTRTILCMSHTLHTQISEHDTPTYVRVCVHTHTHAHTHRHTHTGGIITSGPDNRRL